jgi:hypothetical protein
VILISTNHLSCFWRGYPFLVAREKAGQTNQSKSKRDDEFLGAPGLSEEVPQVP